MTTDDLVGLLRATDPGPPLASENGDRELRRMFVALLWWVAEREELLRFVHAEAARRWPGVWPSPEEATP
jgi:hypothetical protein